MQYIQLYPPASASDSARGYANNVWQVRVSGQPVAVLRCPIAGTAAAREAARRRTLREVHIVEQLHRRQDQLRGFAVPEILGHDVEHGWILRRWIDGISLETALLRAAPAALDELLHALVAAFRTWQETAIAFDGHDRHGGGESALIPLARAPLLNGVCYAVAAFRQSSAQRVVGKAIQLVQRNGLGWAHNDLHLGNIIVASDAASPRLVVIDWEYAAPTIACWDSQTLAKSLENLAQSQLIDIAPRLRQAIQSIQAIEHPRWRLCPEEKQTVHDLITLVDAHWHATYVSSQN